MVALVVAPSSVGSSRYTRTLASTAAVAWAPFFSAFFAWSSASKHLLRD